MRDAVAFVLTWTGWLGLLALGLWVWQAEPLPAALLSYAALGWLGIALGVARRPGPSSRRYVARSAYTVLLVFGLTVVLTGIFFGLWLGLLGAEFALVGSLGCFAESRASDGAPR